ncbi:MAG: hypothetical protein ABI742_06920 [Gemmatimonadota bacterium]
MNYRTQHSALCLLAMMSLASSACNKKEAPAPAEQPAAPAPAAPLTVASVEVGKAIDATKALTGATTTFGPKDTIYVSIGTTGVGNDAVVAAKWSFVKKDGSLTTVNESSQTITTTGPSSTEFHITKATPWPKGKYRVEVTLGGAAAGSKDFDIQ